MNSNDSNAQLFQPRLTREEMRKIYVSAFGEDDSFFDWFFMRYDDAYDSYKYGPCGSDLSLQEAINMTRWFSHYKKIGHCIEWCLMAASFNPVVKWEEHDGKYKWYVVEGYVEKEINYENDVECLKMCIAASPEYNEIQLHCNYLLKTYGKSIQSNPKAD